MFKTPEQIERERINSLRMAAQMMNMRGRCPRCEGKFLVGQAVCDIEDRELGQIQVHDGCRLGSEAQFCATWIQY